MIRVLDKSVADKIAAGEVIERPASVIKELVENSIDAGASSVTVEIKKGGKLYMRVTDDGCGMEKEDVPRAFLRHATSKITTAGDLDRLQTLGFRGEALASICAVSRTELVTRRAEDRTGTRTVLHGGEIISSKPAGCPEGTTIIVEDLFYNTPARLKFMKSDAAESARITELTSQLALAYDNIAFRLISNGTALFATQGDGDRLKVIERVFPDIDTKNLVEVRREDAGISIEGFISAPGMSRPGRSGQIFFVNGRVVNSKVIEKGLSLGYKERLFEGRYPVALLFVTVNADEIDVNIHPNKREVRFDREKDVESFIEAAVKEALGTKEAVVRAAEAFAGTNKAFAEQAERVAEQQIDLKNIMSTKAASAPHRAEIEAEIEPLLRAQIEPPPVPHEETREQALQNAEKVRERITLAPPAFKPFDFDALTVTGCLFGTYITATDADCFYIIDQHAAHERIFYEKLVAEYDREDKLSQTLLLPIMLDVSPALWDVCEQWLAPLKEMGFAPENFGHGTLRITEIPAFMELAEAESFVRDFIETAEETRNARNTAVIDRLIMKACKSAVKAHDNLKPEEARALVDELATCVNPFSCPHGRPTFIKLTEHEIERLFKRV